MKKGKVLDRVFYFVAVVICTAMVIGMPIKFCEAATSIFDGDSVKVTIKGYVPSGQPVPQEQHRTPDRADRATAVRSA